jgi:hypothetical protein
MTRLWGLESDLAVRSERWNGEVPPDIARDRVVIEVAVAFDETSVFVHSQRPVAELDLSAFRAAFCCHRGVQHGPVTWRTLVPQSDDDEPVAWLLYGRSEVAISGTSSSATLQQADQWLCEPDLLCPSSDVRLSEAHHVLPALAETPGGLALSARAFADDRVRAVDLVDRKRGLRFDGRRSLWVYVTAERGRSIRPELCRVLAALLDDGAAAALTRANLARPLSAPTREAQRAWLGVDDATCTSRAVDALEVDADGVVRTPVATDVVVEHWVPR